MRNNPIKQILAAKCLGLTRSLEDNPSLENNLHSYRSHQTIKSPRESV